MAYEVMQSTHVLVRSMAGGSRAFLLGRTMTEDQRDRRQRFVSVGHQSKKA